MFHLRRFHKKENRTHLSLSRHLRWNKGAAFVPFDPLRPTGKQTFESGALSFLFLVIRPRMSTRQIARRDNRFFVVHSKDSRHVMPVNRNL